MPAEIPPGALVAPGAPVTIMKWAMMWLAPAGKLLPIEVADDLVGQQGTYLGVAPAVQNGPTTIRNLAHVRLNESGDEIYVEPHVLRFYRLIDAIGRLDDTPG